MSTKNTSIKNFALTAGLVMGLSLAGAASATQINFYQSGADQTSLASPTIFGGSAGVEASGFNYSGSANDFSGATNVQSAKMYQRNLGSHSLNETGLGVVGGGSTEINTTQFIQLSFLGNGLSSQNIELGISSLQTNESVQFWLGGPGQSNAQNLGSLTGPQTNDIGYFTVAGYKLNGGANNLYVVDSSHDVLLHSMTLASVPEPSALMLMGLGILGVCLSLSGKRSKA